MPKSVTQHHITETNKNEKLQRFNDSFLSLSRFLFLFCFYVFNRNRCVPALKRIFILIFDLESKRRNGEMPNFKWFIWRVKSKMALWAIATHQYRCRQNAFNIHNAFFDRKIENEYQYRHRNRCFTNAATESMKNFPFSGNWMKWSEIFSFSFSFMKNQND